MIEQQLDLPTRDGAMTTFICYPDRGGPHPVILFYMDAPGIREELRDMARRLASAGYYVVLPNLYYRSGVLELGPVPRTLDDPAYQRLMDLMGTLAIAPVMEDTRALLAFIESQDAASAGPLGVLGYCMSGQYAINAAAAFPARVKAAASIYGTHLMTDRPDSPHLAARAARAELYFACAEIDDWAPMTLVAALTDDLARYVPEAEVDVYPGVQHGFAFPDRVTYDKRAAEQHWQRLLALYRRRLG